MAVERAEFSWPHFGQVKHSLGRSDGEREDSIEAITHSPTTAFAEAEASSRCRYDSFSWGRFGGSAHSVCLHYRPARSGFVLAATDHLSRNLPKINQPKSYNSGTASPLPGIGALSRSSADLSDYRLSRQVQSAK